MILWILINNNSYSYKKVSFPLGDALKGVSWHDRTRLAAEAFKPFCPVGWTSDDYFGFQHSFFMKDGEEWARVTVRRWVEDDSV